MLELRIRTICEYLVAFVCGTAILALPVLVDQDPLPVPYANELIPWIRESLEGQRQTTYSLPLLTAFGIALGIWARASAILLAISTIALFPLYSILDIAVKGPAAWAGILGPTMLVLDWLFYGISVLFPLLGIMLARFMRRKLAART